MYNMYVGSRVFQFIVNQRQKRNHVCRKISSAIGKLRIWIIKQKTGEKEQKISIEIKEIFYKSIIGSQKEKS